MSEFKIGDKVIFEFNPGQKRAGKIVDVNRQPGWNCSQYQVKYRGSLSWRRSNEIERA